MISCEGLIRILGKEFMIKIVRMLVASVLMLLPCLSWGDTDWTFEKLTKAFEESGRKVNLPLATYDKVQQQKKLALQSVDQYLTEHLKKTDPAVLKAFDEVPREYFHYNYDKKNSFIGQAYEVPAKPYAVGFGSALSDYQGQVYMTQLAKPAKDQTVLEIGTGSGYQIALLSRMVKDAYSIEIIKPLGAAVAKIFAPLGYSNVHTRTGDGFYGWPEVSGGFDTIMVTCAAQYVPPALLEQLKPGGRLIIPIGQPFKHGQILYIYRKDAQGKIHSRKDVGVYFIPMTGAIQKTAPAQDSKDPAPNTPKP